MKILAKLFGLGALCTLTLSPGAFATEVNEDAVAQDIQESTGLIIQVPVDEHGQELVEQANVHITKDPNFDPASMSTEDIVRAFISGTDVSAIPRSDDSTLRTEYNPALALFGLGLGLAAARPWYRWHGYRYGYGYPRHYSYPYGRPYYRYYGYPRYHYPRYHRPHYRYRD